MDGKRRQELRAGLDREARTVGFTAVGVARADAAPRSAARLRQWLDSGAHGDMIWMETNADRRGSPAALWPEVKSVIALGMSYAPAADPLALEYDKEVGSISVYAHRADDHETAKKGLDERPRCAGAERDSREQ